MHKNRITFFIIFMVSLCSFSQEKEIEKPLEKAKEPSSPLLENIHLHLNKTAFARGERLWYTAYIQDQVKQLPSLSTSNLHIGIYDRSGREIQRKMLYVENGMATGNFAIDSTFVENEYLVLGWTNNMYNFDQLRPFGQQIEIIDYKPLEKPRTEDRFFIEAYPEGGNLVADAFNNIGIRYTDKYGAGKALSNIELVDDSGKIVKSHITTNSLGFGKTGFTVDGRKSYSLRVERPNGKIASIQLPKDYSFSIGLNVDNLSEKDILLKLVASAETLNGGGNPLYTLAIFQNGNTFLEDWKIGPNAMVMTIDRSLIPNGLNTAVLFDETTRPVSWRMFYNHRKDQDKFQKIEMEYCHTSSTDSVQIDFILPKDIQSEMSISVSALPDGTEVYQPQQSIASSFLLLPYVKKNTERAQHYYGGVDRRKRYELDVRLLIEGWGKYDWDSRVALGTKTNYQLENGIMVSGKILDADLNQEKQIYLVTDESKAMGYVDLQSDKSFETSMVLYENDSLGISVIGKKGKLRKPKLDFQIGKTLEKSGYDSAAIFNEFKGSANEVTEGLETEIAPLTLDRGTITLDEVVVSDKVIRDNKLKLNSTQVDGRFIGDAEISRYKTVANYFRKLGIRTKTVGGELIAFARIPGPRGVRPRMFIIINGMLAQKGEVLSMPLSSIQTIVVGQNVFGYSSKASNFISITLREGGYVTPEYRNKFVKTLIYSGYARPQGYFNPRYADYGSVMFKRFGAIDWKGLIVVDNDSPTSIKVPTLNQEKILLFIEGMGADGSIISLEKEISLQRDALSE